MSIPLRWAIGTDGQIEYFGTKEEAEIAAENMVKNGNTDECFILRVTGRAYREAFTWERLPEPGPQIRGAQ